MGKAILLVLAAALTAAPLPQEIQHEAVAVNVEVPVRVFKGNTFIDDLTLEDFEVYEDGKLQRIEAMYLIKKTDIKREEAGLAEEEARKKFAPEVSRNFVLLFELHEFFPNVGKAVEYFFADVFQPEDTLMIVTPSKTYKFNKKSWDMFSRKEIAEDFKEKLRKDIKISSAVYRSLVNDLENVMNFYQTSQEGLAHSDDTVNMVRMMYSNILTKLRNIRHIDEKKLLDFAALLKKMEGQKHVFFFHQKLIVPLLKFSQDYQIEDLEDFEAFLSFDVEKAKMAFSDSSISPHFIFFTKTSSLDVDSRDEVPVTSSNLLDTRAIDTGTHVEMQDLSGSFYDSFKEIVQAAGGTVDSSANAASSFKKAVYASENYYLLYYAPKDYKADGKFREIKVRIKGKNYRISHRSGYIAD